MVDHLLTFALLVGLELVLGVDNILVISILVGRLPPENQAFARRLGLVIAMGARIVMLFGVTWLVRLTAPIIGDLSVRDLVLLGGGLFLIYKAAKEIHHTVESEPEDDKGPRLRGALSGVIVQIVVLDMVFSLDSVITAVGLSSEIWVIVSAVILSFAVILYFAKAIGDYILAHPALKILALAFLVTIGVTLFLEGLHQHVPKGYIYLPMGFALLVETLQMRHASKHRKQS